MDNVFINICKPSFWQSNKSHVKIHSTDVWKEMLTLNVHEYIDGLAQECSALAMELLQSCT